MWEWTQQIHICERNVPYIRCRNQRENSGRRFVPHNTRTPGQACGRNKFRSQDVCNHCHRWQMFIQLKTPLWLQPSWIQTLNTTKPDAISKRSESTANKPANGFWKNVCMSQRLQWEGGSRYRLQWGKKEDTKMWLKTQYETIMH